MICMIMSVCAGCGSSKNIVGVYEGSEAGGILRINNDQTWSYEQNDYWGSGETDWEGTYTKENKNTYLLENEDVCLHAEISSDNWISVYSNSDQWTTEDFKKIGSDDYQETDRTQVKIPQCNTYVLQVIWSKNLCHQSKAQNGEQL